MALLPCNEAAASEVVFIGKVESIQPLFLSRWNATSPASMRAMNQAYATARENPTEAAIVRLRDAYLKAFPELSADEKRQVQGAKSLAAVTSAFYSSLYQGMRVRLRVKMLFKYQDDDDDDAAKDAAHASAGKNSKNDDDDDVKKRATPAQNAAKGKTGKKAGAYGDDGKPSPRSSGINQATGGKLAVSGADKRDKEKNPDVIEIGTPFDDCGIDFQERETYLVYANNDEDTGELSTTSCSRTRRLSDVGEDLSYLFFYKDNPEESARLDGVVTSRSPFDAVAKAGNSTDARDSPIAAVTVELKGGEMTRYAQSDTQGNFHFDGLSAGDYSLSTFSGRYPIERNALGPPQWLHINKEACVWQTIWAPQQGPR